MHHKRPHALVQAMALICLALAITGTMATAAPAPDPEADPTSPASLTCTTHRSISTLLEEMDSWYKQSYSDQAGFISANWLDVSATEDQTPLGEGTVVSAAPAVRVSAHATAPKLGVLEQGETISILDNRTPGWYKISYENGVGYVSAQHVQPSFDPLDTVTASLTLGQQAVTLAQTQLGKPYSYGASGPNRFDCSGLMWYIYQQLGVDIARSSSNQFHSSGYSVPLDQLQPGDLVFFYNPQYDSTGGRRSVTHVGMYAGDNTFIHASTGGDVVRRETLFGGYQGKYVVGAKRIG